MPKDTKEIPIIGMNVSNQAQVKAIVERRKAALVAFNTGKVLLSKLEEKLRAIYAGEQTINHSDLRVLREAYLGKIRDCERHLEDISQEHRESSASTLELFKYKATMLERFWFTDCGPVAQPVNRLLLEIGSRRFVSEDGQTLEASDYTRRQLEKCCTQIQEMLHASYGRIMDTSAVEHQKAAFIERYQHYRDKIINKEPEMEGYLPRVETLFHNNDYYDEVVSQLDKRELPTTVVIQPPTNPPPPPPRPSAPPPPPPQDLQTRHQEALKEALRKVRGGGEPGADDLTPKP